MPIWRVAQGDAPTGPAVARVATESLSSLIAVTGRDQTVPCLWNADTVPLFVC
jgi:hypothetical protein